MNNEITKLHDYYRIQLAEAALDYLGLGLDTFYKNRMKAGWSGYQVAIGNLTISIELMLKSFIASKHLTLLFKSLPFEVRVYLTCPETLPQSFEWQPFDIDIKTASYRMIEFDECVSLLYIFFPNTKKNLQSNLRFISRARNVSAHSFLPKFHSYELERAAFTALKIYEILEPAGIFTGMRKRSSEKDAEFLQNFTETKLERLHKKVENAKESSKKRESSPFTFPETLNHWHYQVISCPICERDSILYGSTDLIQENNEQDENEPTSYMEFVADSFECQGCGLVLDDREELNFVGINDTIDRSAEIEVFLAERRRQRLKQLIVLGVIR